MALTRIPAPAIADVREPNFRNIVINGDMAVAQRATSQASITTSGYYTLDRARTAINNGGTWTQSQSTEVPSGQGFATSLKMDCTTADSSLSSGDYLHVQYPIEAQNLQYLNYGTDSAQTLTLSFWVRSNKTGTYCICLQKSDNTRYDYVAEYSISSADTWEKKTIIIAPDSNIKAAGGAIDNDSGEGFKLKFPLPPSSQTGTNNTWNSSTPADATSNQVNLADSTSNEWYVTGVQLEAGSVATDFEVETFGQNLQRCQRYYEKSYNYADPPATTGSGGSNGLQFGGATANIDASVLMSVRKRAAPTLTVYDLAGTSNKASYYTGSWNNGGSLGGSRAKETYVHVDTNISSSTIVAWQYTAAAEL
jgi:hypothetical protein